ncbi:MAG: hypothetical protein KF912_02350 [Phycisphaeraceae bacterium]|nr:hypothetical protein [Phycisphaeraceae bacterium]MBX3366141.1 hypothetical protein [Phycisphaeraceae bacterium]QYK48639.1 MAG: hypothetical protein KF838_02015 [Phycisphaeraceae bacterium]
MNTSTFFEHWRIAENPFRGEEARSDTVFAKLAVASSGTSGSGGAAGAALAGSHAVHSDFEKIVGELTRPSSSIVFGEKGSGKTAIRMQLAERVARHNQNSPSQRVFLVPYDELNATLDRLHTRAGGKDSLKTLQQIRLVDHIDAIISSGVTRLVDRLTGLGPSRVDGDLLKAFRRLPKLVRNDALILQAVYDSSDLATDRTRRIAKLARVFPPRDALVWALAVAIGWLPLGAVVAWFLIEPPKTQLWETVLPGLGIACAALYVGILVGRFVWRPLSVGRLAHRLGRQIRTLGRSDASLTRSLSQLRAQDRAQSRLPITDSDEQRYAMLDRLRGVLAGLGYPGVIVVIDRVDEPTLIAGDAEKMRAFVWPMLNNKFLQQEGLGVKMLLPIELRHALFRESSAFFQEARLDKQSLVERLSWTGPMLYDLCDARLRVCLAPDAPGIALLDLFAEDVTRQDLIDALDQMHQPRDAFKFLYRCISEHCSNVTTEQGQWRIPRLVLETVRKQESERVQGLYRGIRPA